MLPNTFIIFSFRWNGFSTPSHSKFLIQLQEYESKNDSRVQIVQQIVEINILPEISVLRKQNTPVAFDLMQNQAFS